MPREYDDSGAVAPAGGEQPCEADPDLTVHEPFDRGELVADSKDPDRASELEDPSWIDPGYRFDGEHHVLRPQSGQELSELCSWMRQHSNEFFEGSAQDRVVLIYGIEPSGPVARALREELAAVDVAVGFPADNGPTLDRAAMEARHERSMGELQDEQEFRKQVIEGVATGFAGSLGEPNFNDMSEDRELEPDVEGPLRFEGEYMSSKLEKAQGYSCDATTISEETSTEIRVTRPQDQPPQAPVHQVDIWSTAFVGLMWVHIRWNQHG